MITYINVSGGSMLQLKVKLDNKVVGGIYKTPYGEFYYRPVNHNAGDCFATIEDVKKSLEEA